MEEKVEQGFQSLTGMDLRSLQEPHCYLTVWELLSHGRNDWLSNWGKDLLSPGSTGEGNSAVWPEGVQPGCTSLRPHLRADCHSGRGDPFLVESFLQPEIFRETTHSSSADSQNQLCRTSYAVGSQNESCLHNESAYYTLVMDRLASHI